MAKQFTDFTFRGKKLSDMKTKYISVDFDSNSDSTSLGMGRDMEKGETNRYRVEANYFYDSWSSPIEYELNIVKDPCEYDTQTKMEISKTEIREFTRWLTSSHYPEWIHFKDEDGIDEDVRYYGWFSNVETFVAYGTVYGLKLHFKCTSSFAYTDTISDVANVSGYLTKLITNDSDDLDSYCYPTIRIHPNENGEIFMCNMSDCTILTQGTFKAGLSDYSNELLNMVNTYAEINGYEVKHLGSGAYNYKYVCNDTAIQVKLVDSFGNSIFCTAFYITTTREYRIIKNGFMFMKVYKDLDIVMDCENLMIMDSLDRMITYDKLGIDDVGYMYWLRLMNGNNSMLFYGNVDITIEHIEKRKVGE